MPVADSLLAWTLAATLLTLTPGLDTALRSDWHALVADAHGDYTLRRRCAKKASHNKMDGSRYPARVC